MITIAELFTQVANGATALMTAFGNIFTGLVPLFWTAGVEGGAGQPTILLIFIIAGVVLTLGFWAIDKVIGLAKLGLGGLSRARAKRSKRGV